MSFCQQWSFFMETIPRTKQMISFELSKGWLSRKNKSQHQHPVPFRLNFCGQFVENYFD